MKSAPKILVVDDNLDNMELLIKRFQSLGYRTLQASDGEEALARVAAEEPDLVILDIMMPKLDGLEVCRRLKADERTRLIPVILLTAKREPPDKVRGLDLGADDYVTKPFDSHELVARVRSLLSLRNLHAKRVTEERLGALGQMAEGVAHEVRNPMVTIGGFARRIRDRAAPEDPLREYAEHIIQEVERLEAMVNEIVRFKALMIAPYEPVELGDVLRELLGQRGAAFQAAGLQVIPRIDPDLPLLQGDRENLKLALGNVLENALEATAPGGTVTVTAAGEGDGVRLEVEDTGRGIPRGELPHVFDPFYTSKMAGAGMGLTLVHRIVTRHGGEVDIESDQGRGTRVSISLPRAPGAAR